jgi:DNA helicase-2/ATP-dependent DNA helicase PcrA
VIATAAHLEKLNSEQRQAVEHGIEQNGIVIGPPLLVIAGAGSGQTKTLGSRVATSAVQQAARNVRVDVGAKMRGTWR